jgi:hypothetical protein
MDATPEAALAGIRRLVAEVVADMAERREAVPAPVTQRHGRGLKQAPN